MQYFTPPAVAAEVLPLRIPLGMPRPDGPFGYYEIPPVDGQDWIDLQLTDKLWGAIGARRLDTLPADASQQQTAEAITPHPDEQAGIVRLMNGPRSATDIIAMPLTRAVFDQMVTDGVLAVYIKLAAAAAMAWHLTGDKKAAEQIFTGENRGNPAARHLRTSSSTGGANAGRRASTSGTSSRKKSKKR